MVNNIIKSQRKVVVRLIAVQCLFTLMASLAWIANPVAVYSAVLGGGICILGNLYFSYKVFTVWGAQQAQQIAGAFYRGECGKWLVTIVLFILVFKFVKPLQPVALLASFSLAQLAFWIALLFKTHSVA